MGELKKIVVLGGGESGVGAAVLAKNKGFEVFLSDNGEIAEEYQIVLSNNDIEWEQKQHSESKIVMASEVIKSPGIPDETPLIQMLLERNIPVLSEIEFAGRFSDAFMICVTGSNGKTTTAMLIYHILKKAGFNVGLAGNVGKSLAYQVAKESYDHYVVELSSFQLDGMNEFKADIAVLLNITPDHLDRYGGEFQRYVDSKFRIIQNQTNRDHFIYWLDDPVISDEISKREIKAKSLPFSDRGKVDEGAWIVNEQLIINLNNNKLTMSIHDLALQGKHNGQNSMASGIAARVLEIRKEIIRESLSDFQNVEHRLEFVARVHGIEFINDSKATNVNSTWYALESMSKPVVWIVGGVDKGNDYQMLQELVVSKVKAIVCLGKDNSKIIKAFSGKIDHILEAQSAMDAVGLSYQLATKGEIVLLSPACASFDLFDDYEDRGNKFKRAVKSL
ncbi:MAG TPA: UDP-N-acetylmuramoyl-L-alanine--D-glutamate ligase [Flavobacteriales bacterium]|jgi:UDP-N-acetylmuramoylalanine--D-glutamate ligase|nr:UDP-N-acetylmuramoyl-L-alanine--D-glutamate ligase [Crocinitomicaceae bacterium]HAE32070.1 UDP-N-acetylmuramoyl-L-alanine--D-glutamate ligase [Flavobacteriales bacterium]